MRKSIGYLIIGVFIGILVSSSFAIADQPIKLIVDNQEIESEVPPQIINGTTMVPARPLAEALGASVGWDADNNAVVVTSNIETGGNPTDLPPVNSNNIIEQDTQKKIRIDNISDTTYKSLDDTYKEAIVTVTMTNVTNEYVKFIKPKPIVDSQDPRNSKGAYVWSNKDYIHNQAPEWLEKDGFIPPKKTTTVIFATILLEDSNVVDWEF